MAELRKDYILDKYVIIAKERAKRPEQFMNEKKSHDVKVDYFASGNEEMTPPEIGRREDENGWYLRWFENKFPAVKIKGNPHIETHNEFYTFSDAVGKHEVIVETPKIDDDLSDLSLSHIKDLLEVYNERIEELEKNYEYVCVFKNHGEKAGTSIVHPHSQVVAYNIVPTSVMEKVNACNGEDPYGRIIEREKDSERKVFENDAFICFCPYASRYPLEIIFFPKRYVERLNELKEIEIFDLAKLLKKVTKKLKKINAPYNMYIHYAPKGKKLRLQISICPRLVTLAGFEMSSETIINSVPPEEAAKYYREA